MAGCDVAYDPFAGEGDLLTTMVERCGFREVVGLDIDKKLKWRQNDSLLEIPMLAMLLLSQIRLILQIIRLRERD